MRMKLDAIGGLGRTARARVMLALAATAVIGFGTPQLAAAHDPAQNQAWDQVENIKEAALRLAQMQRTQGATKAFAFIDACYRTHSLSSEYTKPFEACIAQDYMETQILSLVYARTPPEALKKMGAPTPKMLADTMSRRVSAAFGQYKVPKERVLAFQKNVEEHGFPLFFKTLFPDKAAPTPPPVGDKPASDQTAPSSSTPDKTPDTAPEKAPEKKQ
jgi:hypothetical protein